MKLVLDTNIVLDLWVFRDARVAGLRAAIAAQEVTCVATVAMREELACVLAYAQIQPWLHRASLPASAVLEAFDAVVLLVDAPPQAAPVRCRDPDDQKFVDLALAHGALLLSRDRALLALRRKLPVAAALSAPPPPGSGPAVPSAGTA